MAKVPAAQARLYRNVFVCKRCGTKIRADSRAIREGKITCRRCKGKAFRSIKRK